VTNFFVKVLCVVKEDSGIEEMKKEDEIYKLFDWSEYRFIDILMNGKDESFHSSDRFISMETRIVPSPQPGKINSGTDSSQNSTIDLNFFAFSPEFKIQRINQINLADEKYEQWGKLYCNQASEIRELKQTTR
jgi:hypothetical protein